MKRVGVQLTKGLTYVHRGVGLEMFEFKGQILTYFIFIRIKKIFLPILKDVETCLAKKWIDFANQIIILIYFEFIF